MDAGIASLGVAAITGGVSITGLLLRDKARRDERKAQQIKDDQAQFLREHHLDSERADDYRKQLRKLDDDFAALRAKYQEALDDLDRQLEENRDLRHRLEELRIECNKTM